MNFLVIPIEGGVFLGQFPWACAKKNMNFNTDTSPLWGEEFHNHKETGLWKKSWCYLFYWEWSELPAVPNQKCRGKPCRKCRSIIFILPNVAQSINPLKQTQKSWCNRFFAKETGNGTIIFRVINTDDKSNAKITAKFDINAQALYIVKLEKGKEIQKDLTRFAFDYGQSNPGKFKSGLKDEIEKALKWSCCRNECSLIIIFVPSSKKPGTP